MYLENLGLNPSEQASLLSVTSNSYDVEKLQVAARDQATYDTNQCRS